MHTAVRRLVRGIILMCLIPGASAIYAAQGESPLVLEPGHPSLQHWLLPETPAYPAENKPTAERVHLGKMLFFDPRLSGDGNMSCATCHNPMFGWSDGLPTARGFKSKILARATPTVINSAYNRIQMWDGRKRTLEDQAIGPMEAAVEMNTTMDELLDWLGQNPGYQRAFARAYPNEPLSKHTLAKAIANFERTIVSKDSPFDRWVRGDASAMTPAQVNGFRLFVSAEKGNCVACHQAPNFTDDGFHNIGLLSFGQVEPDLGRYQEKPIGILKGAFKTPTLRDVALTAPYFHDGTAADLSAVVAHYVRGGDNKENLSPNMKSLDLSEQEQRDLVEFMHALTSKTKPVELPTLPEGGPVSWAAWRKKNADQHQIAHHP